MEHIYIVFLRFLTKLFNLRYGLILRLYPLKKYSLFKGVWITKSYLNNHNLKIKLFSKSLIDHKILFTGAYEKDTNRILEKHIDAGDIVLEAGANTGSETLLLSKLVERTGHVYAFEPVTHVYNILEENCILNDIMNTTLLKIALGENNAEIDFYIADETFVNQGMGTKVKGHYNTDKKIEVTQLTLDSFAMEYKLPQVNFLKMDIQGGELDALVGGYEMITKHKPKIFLEAGEGWSNIYELFEWLSSNAYNLFIIESNNETLITNRNEVKSGNWLAIPKN